MAYFCYTSTATALWPLPRQRKLLSALSRAADPDARLFHDEIDASQRRLKDSGILQQRNAMLDGARFGDTIDVPSVAVFALSVEDLLAALTRADANKVSVRFLHENLPVTPGSGAAVLYQLVTLFTQAKLEGRATTAGKTSAANKAAFAEERALTVKEIYGDPKWSMVALERKSGVSRNTLIKYLGDFAQAKESYADRAADGMPGHIRS